ncbi:MULTISPECIES: CPBP family intramembrane glutamic endopeptidase [Marinitoga]|jgi:hypothetical protein|uniref:CPBP family intramembrane metalloprotease n=1 Tax=Marinitoga aeolica TaxID=2809031 RepID=A0ABY8PSX9_9BACT|nr:MULTISPECIES: CPBP family intramembrane glutamic endopeptidase [Marinitoga]KAF2955108.1 hypothetical protein AS160_01865 [Marinitoga sp. 38H-ov]MBM7558857.1 membrane protease YdiL (CAAX protease family) [Marinitoga litoralis]WGS65736.1 CPBP family intramembrane metalloprotease [Marinitoga aeolica]
MVNDIESYSFKTKIIIFFHIIAITYVEITSSISYFWAIMFLLYLIAVYIEIKGDKSLKFYFKFNNFTIIFKNKLLLFILIFYLFGIYIKIKNFDFNAFSSIDLMAITWAPIYEEILYRLIVIGFLEIIFKSNKIVCFISAFIFAIVHQQYTLLDGKLFIFIFAIINYYSFKKSKTIYSPMLYHFLNNSFF